MPRVNRLRLLALSDREFNREAGTPRPVPATNRFRPIPLSLARYDSGWDKKRGSAARMMAVVLRESDETLAMKVCETQHAAATYAGAAEWLAGEAKLMRKHLRLLETASARLFAAVQRCATSTT